MKKVMIACVSLTVLAFVSCTETGPVEEKQETIVIEKEVPAVQDKPNPKDGTSISIDKDGVEFSKKEGNTNIEIDLKGDKK